MERLADDINAEPVVYMDCTGQEITLVVGVSLVLGVVIGLIFGIVFGIILVGIAGGLLLSLGITYLILSQLRSIRQQYYSSWLTEKIIILKRQYMGGDERKLLLTSRRFGRGA